MRSTEDAAGGTILARLAVIENKLETLIEEVAAVREYVPATSVVHAERIAMLERSLRTMQWLAGVVGTAMIGAFIAHVFGR